MPNIFQKLTIPIHLLLLTLSLSSEFYDLIIICETIFILLLIIEKTGNGIVILEPFIMHTTVVILLTPLIGYTFFTYNNHLARLWVKYMSIEKEQYFNYTIPCILIYNLILISPGIKNIRSNKISDTGPSILLKFKYIIKEIESRNIKGHYLILVSIIGFSLKEISGESLKNVLHLFYLSGFTGFIFVYFNSKLFLRKYYMAIFILFILSISLASGMFTILTYMSASVYSFLFIGHKTSFFKKSMFILITIIFIFILQNIKQQYRGLIGSNKGGIKTISKLASDEINKDKDYLDPNTYFNLYTRSNQGHTLSNVMKYIPAQKDYDGGERLFFTILSSFVPRLLWVDKPFAGGRESTIYYTGNKPEGNTSMNVSPFGEAYASFGVQGGTLFIIFLALFIKNTYYYLFKISNKYPFIILWLPLIFLPIIYSSETDTLQITNSVVKSLIFLYFMHKIAPNYFK